MRKFIIASLLVVSNSAFACIASENIDIYFDENNSSISNSEVVRVASWVVEQKIYYANHATEENTFISGHAEEAEHMPKDLAKARLQAGYDLLKKLHFLRGAVRASARVYSHHDVDNGRRVEISFLPECPNKCCTGTNLAPAPKAR